MKHKKINKWIFTMLVIILCVCINPIGVRASNMTIGSAGLELIKSFEGCRLTAYKAVASEQYYTIGWGHYGPDVYAGMTITQAQADALLVSDLEKYVNYVNTFLNKYSISVNQSQFDALVSFTYNCGNVWVSTPTFQLKTYLINGISNYTDQQIRVAFTNWNKDGNGNVLAGLTRRRNAEADLFLSGNTGSSCNCSESYSGNYTVTTSSIPLNMRSGHGSSYSVITSIPKGATVYVSKANGSWAHVEYNGYSGYCSMEYLTKVERDIKMTCWFSSTKMGDRISEIRQGQDLYLCYKLYDPETGKLWNELDNRNYSVKQTIYNPDGSASSYTYNSSDYNWIRITPNQTGTYTGKVELTGDRTGTVTCTISVVARRSVGIETWISDTKMGDEKSSINSGEWFYLCYKIANWDSGILLNDLEEYDVDYSVKETIYYPDGTEYHTYTYDHSDNNWIGVKANVPGTYKGVITLNLNGKILYFNEEITVNPQKYQVKYNANGGTGAPSAQTKTQGTALTLSSVKPTKSYTITYDVNGGTLSGTSKKVSCTFVNWNTSSNGSGTSYSAGGSYTKDSAVTLYAQWKNPTAGTLATPTRSGYTFDGWYIKSSGSDNGKKVTSTTTITGNTTLIARWTQNKSTGQISAGKASGSVGEIVAVPIKINKNPGIIALQCKLKYDSAKVQLVDVKGSGILDDSALSTNYAKNPYILSLGDGLNETNITTTGTLATAYFKILPGFTKGTTEIGLTFDVAYDKDVKEVEFTSQNGAIEVKEYIPGDVNRDGYVKLNDAILLRRYVAGWDVTIDLLAADVNRDGQVKLNDAILLRRYVAGWDVTLK